MRLATEGNWGLPKRCWLAAVILIRILCAQAQAAQPAPYNPPGPREYAIPKQALLGQPISKAGQIGPAAQTLGNWVALGPAPTIRAQVGIPPNNPVCGAIQTVAAHPTNPDILYIGAVNGGIWRTINATAANPDWTPLTDTLPSLSIGALEFDPTDATHQTLIGGSALVSSFGADGGARIGVLRSLDGGNTWAVLAGDMFPNENLTSVAARGDILMAASDSTWGGGNGSGLFRSTNAGVSFEVISGAAGPVCLAVR